MEEFKSTFAFESCPLKHHIRVNGWLPACKRQLAIVKKRKKPQRLKYFTFCGSGAVDVLMLNLAKVVQVSSGGYFNTVVFFDRDAEAVLATQINIPGSFGIPADFTTLVLADPSSDKNPLSPNRSQRNTVGTREQQLLADQRQKFIEKFPFDVINLDLEEFLLKPREDVPGRVLRSFAKILEWQQRPLSSGQLLEEFTLMYTTKIGPTGLSTEYREMLQGAISDNINDNEALKQLLVNRTGYEDPATLRENNFNEFFRISVPKLLAGYLREHDWYADPDPGISVFEFDRPSKNGGYKMLHFVMHVKRQSPPKPVRRPDQRPVGVANAYKTVVERVFTDREIEVSPRTIDEVALVKNLNRIFALRKKLVSGGVVTS